MSGEGRPIVHRGSESAGQIREHIRLEAKLVGEEGQCDLRDHFAALDQTPRIKKRAVLERQAELCLRLPALIEQAMIGFIEGPVADQGPSSTGRARSSCRSASIRIKRRGIAQNQNSAPFT